jgi:hypothetical protein
VNLQNLKNSISGFFTGITGRLNGFLAWLAVPLNLFRFVTLLLAVDFIAFMALTKSSYFNLLNPVFFLSVPKGETRQTLELYFPRSLSLTGIEKIYAEDEAVAPVTQPGADGKTAVSAVKENAKTLDEGAIQAEVILIKKRVAKPLTKIDNVELSAAEAKARRVIYELIAGPAGALETLKARNLLKEKMFLRSLWTYEGKLYISTEKAAWEKMSPNEQKVVEYCIVESLKKNLPAEKFALLKE